jgi:hypothetical protein
VGAAAVGILGFGLKQAAEKRFPAVILSMDSRERLSVIPESGRGKRVMNLLNPNSLRVHFLESEAKNLALRIFMNIRDSSSPAAPL